MKIEIVTEIPKRRESRKSTPQEMIERFEHIMSVDGKFGKLTFTANEYKTVYSARSALNVATKSYGYPLYFKIRNGELYFERLDR